MSTFVQFFTMSTGYIKGTIPPQFGTPYPVEACGDRGILQIDGRLSNESIRAIAERECKARGFIAWQVMRGESLLTAKPLHSPVYINSGRENTTTSAAYYGN